MNAQAMMKAKAMMLQAIERTSIDVPVAFVRGGYPINDPIVDPGITILMQVVTKFDENGVN